jgi:hypothetical protein
MPARGEPRRGTSIKFFNTGTTVSPVNSPKRYQIAQESKGSRSAAKMSPALVQEVDAAGNPLGHPFEMDPETLVIEA